MARNNPNLSRAQKRHLKLEALRGVELVDGVTRLFAMNLLLHGVGPNDDEAEPPARPTTASPRTPATAPTWCSRTRRSGRSRA